MEYEIKSDNPSAISIDFRRELNEQQFAAVTSGPGPALVLAGAGSGKTRTLIYRVAWLLQNGIPASDILLLTFTNKAAREMLERVHHLLGYDTQSLWGGTFHSIGNRILRRFGHYIGFSQGFTIMDREDQEQLLRAVIKDRKSAAQQSRFPKPDVVASLFSLAVNTDTDISDVVAERYPYLEALVPELTRLREEYERRKRDIRAVDFDDLLTLCLDLFHQYPAILEQLQQQFHFILVDEYQDTNQLQSNFIEALAAGHRNLMVVGDDAQSIYSWRGANYQNIIGFPEQYKGTKVYKIETNYRSVPGILKVANACISQNRVSFEKKLKPTRADHDGSVNYIPLKSTSVEALFIAQRVAELMEVPVEPSEIAILYRAHYQSMELQMELTKRRIPFRLTSGLRFFEQAHIKDLAAFLRFVVNRHDELSFRRIARFLPGLGDVTLKKIWSSWLEHADGARAEGAAPFLPVWNEMPTPAKSLPHWKQLGYTLEEMVDGGSFARPEAMLRSAFNGVYDDFLQTEYANYDSRKQDIEQLISFSNSFDDPVAFLGDLALLSGLDTGDSPSDRDEPKITLSSIHQAKGLEWKEVFVMGLADGTFPSNRVLDNDDEDTLEEERRLFYVAITRARDHLHLVYPQQSRSTWAGDSWNPPSRFITEIPEDYYTRWTIR